jgi:hypothetical protein
MKLRFIKRYVDESDPNVLILEADVFKSKHQPEPDERVKLRIPIENAYVKKEIKEQAMVFNKIEDVEMLPEEVNFEELGVYNVSVLYMVMSYIYRYLGIIV